MWYAFACSICDANVPDHWVPECQVCPTGTGHVLCEKCHGILEKAGFIKGYEVMYEGANQIGAMQGEISVCPTKAVMLGITMMKK